MTHMCTGRDSEVFTTWVSEIEGYNACLVCLCGELDLSSTPQFVSEMKEVVSLRMHVILDVHLLDYLDSSGAAAILSIKRALDKAGCKMCLTGCHGLVSKVLSILRMDTEITSFDEVNEALNYIRGDN